MRLAHIAAGFSVSLAVSLGSPGPAHADVQADVLKSAVTIVTEAGSGSGFFIASDQVMTAFHVLEDAQEITVASWDGSASGTGRLIAFSEECDVATLRVEQITAPPLALRSTRAQLDETVFAVGSPIGRPVLSAGRVTALTGQTIRTSVPVEFGNSGGPLVDDAGAVLGVVVQKDFANEAVAVPIQKAQRCLENVVNTPNASPATTAAAWPQWLVPVTIGALILALTSFIVAIVALVVASRRRRPIRITLDPQQK